MIRIIGNTLYQWDSNRQVLLTDIDADANEVHFAQVCSHDNALVVEVKEDEDGNRLAYIPNSFLVQSKNIYCWTWGIDKTISFVTLYVTKRNKPSDFIYTPTEVITIEALKEWVRNQIESMKDIVGNNDYVNLKNKPSIEGVELDGDRKLLEFGISLATNNDIDDMFD